MSDFFWNLESLLSCHFAFFLFLYSSCQVNTFKPSDSCCQLEGGCAVVSPACAAGFLRLVAACCGVSCVVADFLMVMALFCAQLRTLFCRVCRLKNADYGYLRIASEYPR